MKWQRSLSTNPMDDGPFNMLLCVSMRCTLWTTGKYKLSKVIILSRCCANNLHTFVRTHRICECIFINMFFLMKMTPKKRQQLLQPTTHANQCVSKKSFLVWLRAREYNLSAYSDLMGQSRLFEMNAVFSTSSSNAANSWWYIPI